MYEYFPSQGELQRRSGAIIEGLQFATQQGLSKNRLRGIERENPTHHRDLFLVLLGLKPFAAYLKPIFQVYTPQPQIDYLTPISESVGSGFVMKRKAAAIWNPELVRDVLKDNLELLDQNLMGNPNLLKQFLPPSHPAFCDFMAALSLAKTEKSITLEGAIYGFPKKAAEFAAKDESEVSWLVNEVLRKLKERKVNSILTQKSIRPIDLMTGEGELKAEVIKWGRRQGHKRYLLDLLAATRDADVPGFPYFTTQGLTTEEEAQLRDAYASSEMDLKLDQFLVTD